MYSADQGNSNKNIVIVEDDRTTAKILEIQLVRLGYCISRIFTSPSEALREISRYTPDLIIMGISFPGDLDGVEAARILTADRDVPIVFLTASMEQDTYQRAMQVRQSGYMVKPPDKVKLKEVITEVFAHRTHNSDRLPGTTQGVLNIDKPVTEIHKTLNH